MTKKILALVAALTLGQASSWAAQESERVGPEAPATQQYSGIGAGAVLDAAGFALDLNDRLDLIQAPIPASSADQAAPQVVRTLRSSAPTIRQQFADTTLLAMFAEPPQGQDLRWPELKRLLESPAVATPEHPRLGSEVLSKIEPWMRLFQSDERTQRALAATLGADGLAYWRAVFDGFAANGFTSKPLVFVPANAATPQKIAAAGLRPSKPQGDSVASLEAAGLVHDLKSPLTVVYATLSLVREKIRDPARLKLIEDASRTNKLLSLRIERWLADVKRNKPGAADLGSLLERAIPLSATLRDQLKRLNAQIPEAEPRSRLAVTLASAERVIRRLNILRGELNSNGHAAPLAKLDPVQLAEREAHFLKVATIREKLDISVQAEPDLPPILANADWTSRILQNLLFNAKNFTPPGGFIRLRVEKDPKRPGFVRFSVTDSGPGLSLEDQSKLFEAFGQTAEGESLGGTGLGLYNVKTLAHRQGGDVWVESEKGQGASFFFTLPAAP